MRIEILVLDIARQSRGCFSRKGERASRDEAGVLARSLVRAFDEKDDNASSPKDHRRTDGKTMTTTKVTIRDDANNDDASGYPARP